MNENGDLNAVEYTGWNLDKFSSSNVHISFIKINI